MLLLCDLWSFVEKESFLAAIITPVIGLWWYFYLRKQDYFKEILGVYAGYTKASEKTRSEVKSKAEIDGGVIMNFKDLSEGGFFRGEFDFRENLRMAEPEDFLNDGFHSFYCQINYRIYRSKNRNPLKANKNRIYKGKFYIVDRLDFQFEKQKIEDYIVAEYDVIHYREMRVIKFENPVVHKDEFFRYPQSFTLYKSLELTFEPYKSVWQSIFRGFVRADK